MTAPNKLLKLSIVGFACAVIVTSGLSGRAVSAYVSGPPSAHTGAPGEVTCTECHDSFALNSGPGSLTITGLPDGYSPNQEVTITVTLTQASRPRYGFQLTAIDDSGKQAGTLVLTNSTTTQLLSDVVGGNPRRYIEHTFEGTDPAAPNQGRWSFKWVAPASSAGRITFYAVGNAANGNGNTTGDFIYAKSASLPPALPLVVSVLAASFAPGAASEAIASAFGTQLATQVVIASGDTDPNTPGIQLPTSLAGTTVKVKDSLGIERLAPLFFVSSGQINYQIPAGTALGAATLTVTSGDGTVSAGNLQIDSVAPGLFTATSDGLGVPVALVRRFRNNQEVFPSPLAAQQDAQGHWIPLPIDLGPETDLVLLEMYCTGLRAPSSLAAVNVKIGGADGTVFYAGLTPGFVGLDQVDVSIPRSLIGRGDVNIVLTVDGKTANTVMINIR